MAASMQKSVVLCVFIHFAIVSCDHSEKVKEYTFNLDSKEEDRWTEIVKDHSVIAQKDIDNIIGSVIPKELLPLIEILGENIDDYLPSPFAGEIRGIAKASNISMGDIVAVNLMYEATAFCTSIVAQDSNNHIWHGRNLDYGASVVDFTELLRKQTVTIHAKRNNKTVYTATTFVGFTGIVTGMKPRAFTVSLNQRDQGALWENIVMALFDRKALPDSFLVRKTLEHASSYKEAVKMLSTSDTIADSYLIVGGIKPEEGVVITKKHIGFADIWSLNATVNRWYVLETNYDHWNPPPEEDDRRTTAMKAMNATGNVGFNITSLYKVLSTPKVLNHGTAYTTGMSAAYPDLYMSWVRHP